MFELTNPYYFTNPTKIKLMTIPSHPFIQPHTDTHLQELSHRQSNSSPRFCDFHGLISRKAF